MSHYNFLLLLIPVTLNSADVKVLVSQGEMLSRDNPGMLPTELAKTVSGSSGASYGSGLPGDKGATNWPPVVLVAQNSWDLDSFQAWSVQFPVKALCLRCASRNFCFV